MSLNKRLAIAGLAALAVVVSSAPPSAQTAQRSPYRSSRHARPRIEITPRPLLYRRCVDWLELQHRLSGPVLYPQYRCWWVRG